MTDPACTCGPPVEIDGRPIRSIHAACPVHGEKDPLGLGRICSICGSVPVGSTNPETDFCRMCWATGQKDERDLDANGRSVLRDLRALPGVERADVWQTGGGCMVLAITLADGRLITAGEAADPVMPPPEGPWGVVLSETEDAWHEWDEEKLSFPDLISTGDAGLVAFVSVQGLLAAGRAS